MLSARKMSEDGLWCCIRAAEDKTWSWRPETRTATLLGLVGFQACPGHGFWWVKSLMLLLLNLEGGREREVRGWGCGDNILAAIALALAGEKRINCFLAEITTKSVMLGQLNGPDIKRHIPAHFTSAVNPFFFFFFNLFSHLTSCLGPNIVWWYMYSCQFST